MLRDEVLSGAAEGLTMLRSLPHGHVTAVLGIARKIGLDRLLAAGQAPARLATPSSLGPLLELGTVSEQELYASVSWLRPSPA